MSHLNLNLGMNFLTNAKLTTSNFNVKYGANKKDMNKQISFSSTVKHTLAWRASDVRVSAQLQHPESVSYNNTLQCTADILCLKYRILLS